MNDNEVKIETAITTKNEDFLKKLQANKNKYFSLSAIINYVIVLLILGYSLFNVIKIGNIKENPIKVVTNSLGAIIMIYIIDSLLMQKGILKAKETKEYIASLNVYSKEIEKQDENAEFLDKFCEEYNENRRIKVIKPMLKRVHLTLEDYDNGKFENEEEFNQLSERQQETIKKLNKMNFFQIDADFLLVNTKSSDKDKDGKLIGVSDYQKTERLVKILTIVCFAIVSGCITFNSVNYHELLNSLLTGFVNGVIWVAKGVMTYFKYYNFTLNQQRNSIIYKTNILAQFNKIMEKNPDRYKYIELKIEPLKEEQQNDGTI